jgi:urease accessory protein
MGWHASLELHYRRDGARTVAHDRHEGPLRVLQRLYPEGPGICHHVLLHPPGGIVGGDTLSLEATLAQGSHALLTTPGAARFYRSGGESAVQSTRARLADGARLEWLPLETLAYSGCLAENRLRFELAPDAEMIGWDVLALGLPASGQAFERGRFLQALEMPGTWLERGLIDAQDERLLDGPVGLAGQRVLATLWFARGSELDTPRRECLLDAARQHCSVDAGDATAGCTAAQAGLVLLRVLAARVEPAMQLLRRVWADWRRAAWDLAPCTPRVWQT